jgi:DNA-binding HxlR family transcriptional regulator
MELRRPIVLLVLDSDHAEVWSRAEIERELNDTDPLTINDALAHLEAEGVVILDGEQVHASRCTRQLDRLGVICA